MQQSTGRTHILPDDPKPLDLELKYPISSFASIKRGYESQGQDDKWSLYFQEPWVEIWRPSRTGWYCYAIRLEEADDQRLVVAESWGAALFVQQFGLDMKRHRQMVTALLDDIARFSGETFNHGVVTGKRGRGEITFTGKATSLREVDEIADKLRAEVDQMLKDGW